MQFTFKTRDQKRTEQSRDWKRWFAWRPVRLDESNVIFLERIYRKRRYADGPFEYKTLVEFLADDSESRRN